MYLVCVSQIVQLTNELGLIRSRLFSAAVQFDDIGKTPYDVIHVSFLSVSPDGSGQSLGETPCCDPGRQLPHH